MPDSRLAKARATLPAGYQFGDTQYSAPGPIDVRQWPRPDAPNFCKDGMHVFTVGRDCCGCGFYGFFWSWASVPAGVIAFRFWPSVDLHPPSAPSTLDRE